MAETTSTLIYIYHGIYTDVFEEAVIHHDYFTYDPHGKEPDKATVHGHKRVVWLVILTTRCFYSLCSYTSGQC